MSGEIRAASSNQPAKVIQILDELLTAYGEPTHNSRNTPIDELIQTILSQHTSDINTERAFASLRERFSDWDAVESAPTHAVADAIRSGGLADVKAPRIQQVLREVRERVGSYDLNLLDTMSVQSARDWLTELPGVGPKTASCVLLFSMDRPAMPVDTHVHRVALRLGIIPERTSAERAHQLLEQPIPPERMYQAHMLFIEHGRRTCIARRPRCSQCVLVQWCPTGADICASAEARSDRHDDQTH